jgi:[ribosomal protein S5]-alanine N-acetyltransferase
MQPLLESARLVLRPFQESDSSDVKRLAGDKRIADTTTTIPHPYPEGAAQAWIATHAQTFSARSQITYAVTLRGSGVLVGTVSLMDISPKHSRAELGYWTGVEFWGLGYCTEAVCRIIPFAYEHLNTTKIVARCLARNQASARVMEKAGLLKEGHLSKHVLQNGNYEDVLLYGLALAQRHDEA